MLLKELLESSSLWGRPGKEHATFRSNPHLNNAGEVQREKTMSPVLEFADRRKALVEELSRLILGPRDVENEFEEVMKLANSVCDRHGLKKAA